MNVDGLFHSPHRYLLALGAAVLACVLTSALLRHLGAPERFPLTSRATYEVDPDANPYRALVSSRAIYVGDFRPILTAARTRQRDPEHSLYQSAQLREYRAAFVYTPLAALLVLPLARTDMSVQRAADWANAVNHVLWLVGGALLLAILGRGRPSRWLAGIFILHFLLYYPLAKALQLTQVSVLIWFCHVLAAWLLQRRYDVAAGFALAFGASIKPHYVLVPLLCALAPRFPRRALAACAAGLLLSACVSLLYAGWADCVEYVFGTLPTLSAGYSYLPNQSLNGLLLRSFTGEDPAVFNLATSVQWIQLASVLFGLGVLAAAARACRRRSASACEDDALLPLAIALAAVVIASPVSWIHHYVLLTIPYCVAYRRLSAPGGRSRRLEAALFASVVLVGWFFDARHLSGFPLALLGGLEFYGALALFACLLALVRRAAPAPEWSG